jgi:site-specific DNA recombinase
MNKPAVIYARVSSDRQKENHTSQPDGGSVGPRASANGYAVPPEWVFEDEGYSGVVLARPRLEALR